MGSKEIWTKLLGQECEILQIWDKHTVNTGFNLQEENIESKACALLNSGIMFYKNSLYTFHRTLNRIVPPSQAILGTPTDNSA